MFWHIHKQSNLTRNHLLYVLLASSLKPDAVSLPFLICTRHKSSYPKSLCSLACPLHPRQSFYLFNSYRSFTSHNKDLFLSKIFAGPLQHLTQAGPVSSGISCHGSVFLSCRAPPSVNTHSFWALFDHWLSPAPGRFCFLRMKAHHWITII